MVRRRVRRRRLQPEERRAEIVTAAHAVLAGRDPSTVTFEEIASAAGVSRALLYSYFGDRGSLLAAVYTHVLEPLDRELEASLSAAVPAHDRIRAVVTHMVHTALTQPGLWQTVAVLGAVRHPAVQAARQARLERLALGWGGAQPRLVLSGLLGLVEAAVGDWLADPDLEPDQLIALVDDLAWFGVAPRHPAATG